MSGKATRNSKIWLASLACTNLLPGFAMADHELYFNESSKLVLKSSVMGAVFCGSNSWFRESESFLGDDTDSWSEFGGEIGLAWEHDQCRRLLR